MQSFDAAPFIVISETTRYQPATDTPESHGVAAIVGGSDLGAPCATPERVEEALRSVVDPELSLSVVDLGLIYGIVIDGPTVRITMTLTAPGCLLHAVMADWVRRAALRVPGVERVEVAVTFDPPWSPARIAAS